VLDSAEGTTPVFVLRRVAGEGRDMPRSMYNHADNPEDQDRTYLEPDSTELEILQYLNDNFDNTVLVVNTASALDLDFLEDMPNIKSVLFVPNTGTYGLDSLAGILAGDINPSARTADTFSGEPLASPAAQNYGDYQYLDENGELVGYNYVSYAEGIYVGYKYYETRYEDMVMGTGNAGDFSYAAEVTHPFGFGLSYTDFAWSDFSTAWDGDTCTATVNVTNTGDIAGKDVVELYAQSPYTDYDRANGIEKAAVELVGLGKTKLLEPGESQTIEITFDEEQLKAYDANGAKTYILDAGTYYVTAGKNAHDAVNNILAAKGYTTANGMDAEGNAA
ncbi:TPA: glycoside hydrolase family 3 C-terminal domain-containing protein, partial [Clostridioides difficile]|nr:glycoside hydrolase family 3 C-terminal domain-containing protein [Clostridioides difficile]